MHSTMAGMRNQHEATLQQLIFQNEWVMTILRTVRRSNLPDWLVGAGLIRNLVWDHLHDYRQPTPPRDVDVAFFDAHDLSPERDAAATAQLAMMMPGVDWEATNQASVHLWYEEVFGQAVSPFTSTTEAIATWPETATCTAVRLLPDDSLHIVAPFGLEDLFEMILRRNPVRVTVAQFHHRLREKQIKRKWPLVKIINA